MSSTIVIGIIGIFVAIVVLNYVMYIGLNPALSGILAAAIICLTSGLNFIEAWDIAIGEFSGMLGALAPLFIFGGILGVFYTSSGAADSLANVLMIPANKCTDPKLKIAVSILMLLILKVLLSLAGLDNLAIMATMVYILVSIMNSADIPRKYANAILMVAGTVGSLVPGAATSANLILEQSLVGYTANSLAVIRWILLIAYIVVCILIFTRLTLKSREKGIHFDYGPLEHSEQPNRKLPHWITTLLPMIVVYVTYNFVHLPSWISLFFGCVLALILFGAYIPSEEGKSKAQTFLNSVNKGTNLVPLVIIFTMLAGFFLSQSEAYGYLSGIVASIPIHPAFILLIMAVVLIGVAGMGGIVLSAMFAAQVCLPAGMSAAVCGMIILWSTTVLDTLPNSLGIVMQNQLCGTTMKEAYPSIFQTTVVVTFVFTLIASIIAAIGIV